LEQFNHEIIYQWRRNMGSVPDLLFTTQIALALKGSVRYRRAERSIAIGTALLAAWLLPGATQAVIAQEAAPRTGPLQVADSPALRVGFKDSLLSIEARQRPWLEVLNAVREKTGIRINRSLPLVGSVTVSFTALPVKQALERLFGPEAHFVLRYPNSPDRAVPSAVPKEVWVLGKVPGDRRDTTPTPDAAVVGEISASAGIASPDPGPPLETLDLEAKLAGEPGDTPNEPEEIGKLIEMTKADDPVIRLQALLALSESDKIDEVALRAALDGALVDQHASVRGYAVQAIADRGGAEAMDHLWQAMRDPDPVVRVMAVESVVPQEQGIALIEAALSDPDEAVRSAATLRLNEMEQAGSGIAEPQSQAPAL
jgi:hypothetical protein